MISARFWHGYSAALSVEPVEPDAFALEAAISDLQGEVESLKAGRDNNKREDEPVIPLMKPAQAAE